ncbi:hypothetical protein BX600DRAFT_516516 [Xylariales sp. PMI_506]|nr:hypothetical protein BX600DRAFT_516516 [Xylariales sp. PMI_506]
MSLTTRLTSVGPADDPEDFLADSLAVVFPEDVMNQHGDATNALRYASPHLPAPLLIRLADPDEEDHRRLFGHYLWNASLMLAEFVEAGCLGLQLDTPCALPSPLALGSGHPDRLGEAAFDVRGLATLELGAGTALPSMLAALLGARCVVVTDYPAPPIMEILRENIAHNVRRTDLSPIAGADDSSLSQPPPPPSVLVEGHAWGELDTPFALEHKAAFDRLFVCDCLWMPWQHDNLRRSIAWFMKEGTESRAWIVAGFHTGRHNMAGFFDEKPLAAAGLEVDKIWERDVNGEERDWEPVRKDDSMRRRWMVVAVLKRTTSLKSH